MNTDDLVKIEQYRRFLRPDWRRWLPPDPERGLTREQREALRHDFMLRDLAFETPLARRLRKEQEAREREEQERLEAEHHREIEREALQLKAELAALRFELVWAEFCSKAGFNPDQPRVPAGNPDGGQWTDGASSADSTQDHEVQSDEISAARRTRGHHYVTRELFEKLKEEGLSDEALKVFEEHTTGPLADPSSNWYDAEHRLYNRAVEDLWKDFKERNNIQIDRMTADEARDFVREVVGSDDARIGGFLRRMWLREFIRRGMGGRRGNE